MAWTKSIFLQEHINNAGALLAKNDTSRRELASAVKIINNWRTSHAFPLNFFQIGLRRRASRVDAKSLVAQRLKRLSAIKVKLARFEWLSLYDMQDLGGCRAVLDSVKKVYELAGIYTSSKELKLNNKKDYIETPKSDGYRGIHLIYQYNADKREYRGMKIEIQIRSQLQHAWATAVETVDTFTFQGIKTGGGTGEWRRFFKLMGTAIALRENCTLVPNTPVNPSELANELRSIEKKLNAISSLVTYGSALQQIASGEERRPVYYLLVLDPVKKEVTVRGYMQREIGKASKRYAEEENLIKGRPGASAVLVSAKSLEDLRSAYPNYFLDTRTFVEAVQRAIQ